MKKIIITGFILVLSLSGMAQTTTKLTGEDATALCGISKNGRYGFGLADQGSGVYFYDLASKELQYYDGAYADGISDNGILAGALDVYAAYCLNGEWHKLPIPENKDITEILDYEARGISANGEYIVGDMSMIKGPRKPCLWTRQPDGSYRAEFLPEIEKDLTGRTPQATDALRCSASGEIIYGRLIDWSGMLCMPVYWKKDANNKWACHLLGKDVIFKEGAVIPVIPEEEEQSPKTLARRVNNIGKDQKAEEIIDILTGVTFDMYTTVISNNGRYLGITCKEVLQDGNPGGTQMGKTLIYPAFYDLQNGNWEFKRTVKDGIIEGVTDNGEVFYATSYIDSDFRNSYIFAAGSEKSINLSDWVKQKTNGAINISTDPDLLFDLQLPDGNGGIIEVIDTLIAGTAIPSSDGKVIMSFLYSINTNSYLTYFIDLEDKYTTDIKETTSDGNEIMVYPNPVSDILYINGKADTVRLTDLAGCTVFESSSGCTALPVHSFSQGTYLVRITANGKITTHKIMIIR